MWWTRRRLKALTYTTKLRSLSSFSIPLDFQLKKIDQIPQLSPVEQIAAKMGGGKRSSFYRRGGGQSRSVFVGGDLLDDWNRPSFSPASSTHHISGSLLPPLCCDFKMATAVFSLDEMKKIGFRFVFV